MLIDYLREYFGFAKFDPDENEVKRYVTENYDYHERVTNLQYLPTEEEISFLARRLPIQICGEPSEQREVSNYKDLERVESNFIRGGMCLIFSEGLAQKAQKGLRLLRGIQEKGFKTSGWDYLEEFIEIKNKREKGKSDGTPTYIKDLVAGRPVFGHPSREGGFRFRYGRTRTGGFSAMLVHPATMAMSNDFLSSGVQLKIEKPTKGCAISVCDGMDGPIVKLKNGSVRKPKEYREAKALYKEVDEILYFGDLLVPLGDVINRNYELIKPGYVEEWWALELEKVGEKVDGFGVSFEEALKYSEQYGVPMHPEYIYFWRGIERELFFGLLDWLSRARVVDNKLIFGYDRESRERFKKGKRALELIGCEHEVTLENVILNKKNSESLIFNLGIEIKEGELEDDVERISNRIKVEGDVLEMINLICRYKIKDKSGTFIGARMGRPEKAKLRKLTGSPHVLFPVGEEGGRLRSFQSALERGFVKAEFPLYKCKECELSSVYSKCRVCKSPCILYEDDGKKYKEIRLDIMDYYEHARKMINLGNDYLPQVIKGIRGTSSENHDCEFLPKGLLRSKYNLHVNKDGTIRYDMTEMAITHFKPREIRTSVEKLKILGYDKDINGAELENNEQILELLPHDVILPSCPDSDDEKADDVCLKTSKFIDDELDKVYGVERMFNAQNKEDVIGMLVYCIAPHICTATVGRVIGFSKVQALMASPYMHAAMRRDCDGDEAAFGLLMDLLLNFSKKFLPAHRGGTQDSPLVLNTRIRAGEVDEQILDFLTDKYPLELYEKAEEGKHSSEIKVESIKERLAKGIDPFTNIKYTHECSSIDLGVVNSAYKTLPTMKEKVDAMMDLCKKIRAVDTSDSARLIIERHFIRDIRGNLRKFSMQGFRCVSCNGKYRRPPLVGKCTKCGGKLIFTISHGSIIKYMQPALELAKTYGVSKYLLESLELTEMFIQSIFGKEKERQESIEKWF